MNQVRAISAGAHPRERVPESRESEVEGQKAWGQVTGSREQNMEASRQSLANLKRGGGMARAPRLRRAAGSAETMAGNRKQPRKHQERIAEVDEAVIRLYKERGALVLRQRRACGRRDPSTA